MKKTNLENSILQLYQRLYDKAPSAAIISEIREAVVSNGLELNCPEWLTEMLAAIADDLEFEERIIGFEELNGEHFDVSNFLAELDYYVGIPVINNGESVMIELAALNRWALIDKEAIDGNVRIKVVRSLNEF
jgi:hypothetical protein